MKMKKYKYVLISIPVLVAVFLLIGATNSYYYKINKSFDIFGELFRQISRNYVEEVDPEVLVQQGVYGMLNYLDPYTVYFGEEEIEDADIAATGSYTGIGITVGFRDSMMTIVEVHDGYPADLAGVRVGDRILKIDTVTILNSLPNELRQYTRGEAGGFLNLTVLRGNLKDTLEFRLKREEIKLKNVSYYGMINDSVAYIKIDRFTRNTVEETSEAYRNLNRLNDLKGLIIDLRNNPGGLLGSAVGLCEMFVPKNSLVVTTKSRNKVEREFKTFLKPTAPNLKLAILINGSSASAAEVVAGAIQDLDRGLIVGKRSFGKGLVQSIYELPHNTAVKMTTSKYYTPSGRCIQKINYGSKDDGVPDTSLYKTKNGRLVEESLGIKPDSTVEESEPSYFVRDLMLKGMFFKFANIYTSKLDELPSDFSLDDKTVEDFYKYLEDNDYYYQTPLNSKIDEMVAMAKKEKLDGEIEKKLKELKKNIQREEKDIYHKHKKEMKEILERKIARRLLSGEEFIKLELTDDIYVKTASNLLSGESYGGLLGINNDKGERN